jgi:hypothetical protein
LNKISRQTHLLAAILFTGLTLFASFRARTSNDERWQTLSTLALIIAIFAWILHFRARRRDSRDQQNLGDPASPAAFPEGQARLIDSGRLPNRYNARLDLKDFEICHFSVMAQRMIFAPLPESLKIDPTRLAVRYSGGNYYYIVRPQEILLPADVVEHTGGEFVITSQRIMFLAAENGFEVTLQSLKLLDCSAHLIDFQIRNRRYTLLTEAACYAEKVLLLLLQPPTV